MADDTRAKAAAALQEVEACAVARQLAPKALHRVAAPGVRRRGQAAGATAADQGTTRMRPDEAGPQPPAGALHRRLSRLGNGHRVAAVHFCDLHAHSAGALTELATLAHEEHGKPRRDGEAHALQERRRVDGPVAEEGDGNLAGGQALGCQGEPDRRGPRSARPGRLALTEHFDEHGEEIGAADHERCR